MIKKVFSIIFGLILALPAYTGSMPGKAPVPEKGQTSSPQEPAEQVIIIRTAPKDAKGDQVTVGKKGEIQVPRSTEGSRFPSIAPANVGGILGGGVPSGFNRTTVPIPLPINQVNQGKSQTPITPPSLPTAQLQALLDAQVSDA